MFSSVSYITLAQLGLRIIALLSPAAALQLAVLVAQIALYITDLVTQWQSTNNCWVSNDDMRPRLVA